MKQNFPSFEMSFSRWFTLTGLKQSRCTSRLRHRDPLIRPSTSGSLWNSTRTCTLYRWLNARARVSQRRTIQIFAQEGARAHESVSSDCSWNKVSPSIDFYNFGTNNKIPFLTCVQSYNWSTIVNSYSTFLLLNTISNFLVSTMLTS